MTLPPDLALYKEKLDTLYHHYNQRSFVHPDPLEFLFHYDSPGDREIVGLIASSLAYGRVAQILKSVSTAIKPLSPYPSDFLKTVSQAELFSIYKDFKHRFTTGQELASLLCALKGIITHYDTIENCFTSFINADTQSTVSALSLFVEEMIKAGKKPSCSLLPLPTRGSACKRLHLFLRWMVRNDKVDPGGWSTVSPSHLVVPLDTHLHKICRSMGITKRKQADIHTSVEITSFFKKIMPHDPVRYDFALTRLGIRTDADLESFLRLWNE